MNTSNHQSADEKIASQLVSQCREIGRFVPVKVFHQGMYVEGVAWRSTKSWKVIKLAVKRGEAFLLFTASLHRKGNKFRGGECFSPTEDLIYAFAEFNLSPTAQPT